MVGAVDYKMTFAKNYNTENEYAEAVSKCHTRTSERVLKALLANGGKGKLYEGDFSKIEE